MVQDAYVAGVSTRKVDRLVESLGLRISKSEVSRVCASLDEQVEAFRNRPLEGRYPYLWLDSKVEKVRDGGRVVRKALVLAYAAHESGYREVIVGECETEAFWRSFLRDRALIRLATSVVIEQNDEWLVGHRYLSNHSLEAILDDYKKDNNRKETPEPTAA